jgi:hypothetical protein
MTCGVRSGGIFALLQILAHKYMGNYRIPDTLTHPWDRSMRSAKEREDEERRMFKPDPDAGKRNIHQPIG